MPTCTGSWTTSDCESAGHAGQPPLEARVDEHWERAFRRLAALPNTVCKLSGILSAAARDPVGAASPDGPSGGPGPDVAHLRPYYEMALDSFGPDRMMFGSDWPVSTLGASYGDVVGAALALTADLSRPERSAIFGGTARRAYQLDGRP